MLKTPCEIIQWDVLPALRKELIINLVKAGLSRQHIAKLFDISEPAISQYISSKRGSHFKFSNEVKQHIQKSAKHIVETMRKETIIYEICKLCAILKKQKVLCKLHHKQNPGLAKCNLHKICGGIC